jgi:hypothetical protein
MMTIEPSILMGVLLFSSMTLIWLLSTIHRLRETLKLARQERDEMREKWRRLLDSPPVMSRGMKR